MACLEIRLLGSIQVYLDEKSVTGFRSDKARALLVYLILEGSNPIRREKLAGLLWPELTEQAARANLRYNLTHLKTILNDRDRDLPLLKATRQTIQFTQSEEVWVDTFAFIDLINRAESKPKTSPSSINWLEEAVSLYNGDFLAGFSLPNNQVYEEWIVLQRERHKLQLVDTLRKLAEAFEKLNQNDKALLFARRQLELDPLYEKAHRQVMRLLVVSGLRGEAAAQYRTCQQILKKELGVEPAPETQHLYRQILMEDLTPDRIETINTFTTRPEIPVFLRHRETSPKVPVFLCRDEILEKLYGSLQIALDGEFQVLAVTGEAGSGKTALLTEFSRRATSSQADLLIASSKCSAIAGSSNALAPFCEILAILSGDIEARFLAGNVSRKLALRIWEAIPLVAESIVNHGPQLVSTLLSGASLASRASLAAGETQAVWLQKLHDLGERQHKHIASFEKSLIFEQFANTLVQISREQPLMLILDDIHWIDAVSSELLFHLTCRLQGSRIMIVCAYRPEEMTGGFQATRQRIKKILMELKSQFSDFELDLDTAVSTEAEMFVDRLIDTEPNQLNRSFRDKLCERTGGHPLFTIELLRAMQDQGDLRVDSEGRWVLEQNPDWAYISSRVEGVIENRIHNLDGELQRILSIASVEGEIFTAQAITKALNIEEMHLQNRLSQELERKYRLVHYVGERQVGQTSVSKYQFGHGLFREFIYKNINPGERKLIHNRVGEGLEIIYSDHVDKIAAQLAVHFMGIPEKERKFCIIAATQAAKSFDSCTAINYFKRALELTTTDNLEARFDILLLLERIYFAVSDAGPWRKILCELEEIANSLGDVEKQSEVCTRLVDLAILIKDSLLGLISAEKAFYSLKTANNTELMAKIYKQWGRAHALAANFDQAIQKLELALDLVSKINSPKLNYSILRQLSHLYSFKQKPQIALNYLRQAEELVKMIGNQLDEAKLFVSLGIAQSYQHHNHTAVHSFTKGLELSRKIGYKHGEFACMGNLGISLEELGDYPSAEVNLHYALAAATELGITGLEVNARISLGSIQTKTGHLDEALTNLMAGLEGAQHINDPWVLGYCYLYLGDYHLAQGDYKKAMEAYCDSYTARKKTGIPNEIIESKARIAFATLNEGDKSSALDLIEEILPDLDKFENGEILLPLSIYLISFKVLKANNDIRKDAVIKTAYELLQKRASVLKDTKYYQTYLGNVKVHQEILAEHERIHKQDIAVL